MRTLTSVQSSDHVTLGLAFTVTPQDGLDTWTFRHDAVTGLQAPTWEVPFGGGLGLPISYRITLASSEGFWQSNLKRLPGAVVRVTVAANSDTYQPHRGVVRGITRDGADTDLAKLDVSDFLMQQDPTFPEILLTDSWGTPHLEDLTLGYPSYYGLHHRPAYFAAITCDLNLLLGPRNVSSANHVSSLFFNSDMTKGSDIVFTNNLLMNKTWDQQSGATNVACGGYPFELYDPSAGLVRLFQFDSGLSQTIDTPVTSDGLVRNNFRGHIDGRPIGYWNQVGGQPVHISFDATLRKTFSQPVKACTRIFWSCVFSGENALLTTNHQAGLMLVGSYGTPVNLALVGSDTNIGSLDISAGSGAALLVESSQASRFFQYVAAGSFDTVYYSSVSIHLYLQLAAGGYERYSVFAPVVDSGEVAISTNPVAILDDICSRYISVPYLQGLSSGTQVQVQSIRLQCLFDEPRKFSEIADDFGKLAGFYVWAGDSGNLQYRAYVESATATSSIDAVITRNEMLSAPQFEDQPIGLGGRAIRQVHRVKLKYGFDHQLGAHTANVTRDRTDNALCNSANAAGIRDELTEETPYITHPTVASLAANNLTRRHAQGFQAVTMRLPAMYLGLEPADIIQIRDGMLTGSQDLFQIYRLTQDWLDGTVEVTAGRLQNTDGS